MVVVWVWILVDRDEEVKRGWISERSQQNLLRENGAKAVRKENTRQSLIKSNGIREVIQ